MPNGINNWKFEEIVAFLKDHGFTLSHVRKKKGGSHHYYERTLKGIYYLTHVQYHARKSIPPGTMKTIISTSGIPEKKWRGK